MANKTLYHSDLKVASQSGAVAVKVVGPPTLSKWPGKPPFCRIEFAGVEHFYNIENTEIGNTLLRFVGQTIEVTAGGSGEQAYLQIAGQATRPAPYRPAPVPAPQPAQAEDDVPYDALPPAQARPAPPVPQRAAPVARQATKPVQAPTAPIAGGKPQDAEAANVRAVCETAKRHANLQVICMMATQEAIARLGMPVNLEWQQALCSSLFISLDRLGQAACLPTDPVELFIEPGEFGYIDKGE